MKRTCRGDEHEKQHGQSVLFFLLPALLYELYQFLYEVCPVPDDHYNGDQRVQEIQDAHGHHSHL